MLRAYDKGHTTTYLVNSFFKQHVIEEKVDSILDNVFPMDFADLKKKEKKKKDVAP